MVGSFAHHLCPRWNVKATGSVSGPWRLAAFWTFCDILPKHRAINARRWWGMNVRVEAVDFQARSLDKREHGTADEYNRERYIYSVYPVSKVSSFEDVSVLVRGRFTYKSHVFLGTSFAKHVSPYGNFIWHFYSLSDIHCNTSARINLLPDYFNAIKTDVYLISIFSNLKKMHTSSLNTSLSGSFIFCPIFLF